MAAARDDPAGDLVASVAQVLARLELEAPPLVVVAWQPRLAVLVFGDVELSSDHPAVPLLTGRGSRTWVEHSLPGGAEDLRVSVSPPDDGTNADTDLQAGVVPAGGVCVELSRPAPGPGGTLRAPATPAPHVPEPPAGPAASPPPVPPTAAATNEGESPAPDAPTQRLEPAAWRPPATTSVDPEDVLGLIQAAAVGEEEPDAPAAVAPEASASEDQAPEAPAPEAPVPSDQVSEAPAPEDTSRRPLVDAVRCPGGHASPPGSSTCRSCGALLAPGAPTEAVPRPVLGVARFDDGVELTVDGDVALGRRPPADGRTVHVLEGDRVSRHHADLQVRGWDVLLHDPGSRNGTYVVAPGASDPFRVDPEVPTRLEIGSRIYLGTRSFSFEAPAGSPAGSDDDATTRP